MSKDIEKFILDLYKLQTINSQIFWRKQRDFAKNCRGSFIKKDELVQTYQKMLTNGTIDKNVELESLFKLKKVRSQSGIAVVSVLTKPYMCPGSCIYCPSEPGVPKSYLSGEPAVMRAINNKYHPASQVKSRLMALEATGHVIDKISVRIIGGSFSAYPKRYKNWFINNLYRACNEYKSELCEGGLKYQQDANEKAKSRIVELSIETRPDMINEREIIEYRKFGVTKVELGVQSLDDDILKLNKRQSTAKDIIRATKLLKDYGFKVSYQMMLNLYGSDLIKDYAVFEKLFENHQYRPDHLKIYPLALVKNSDLYAKYKNKKFKPYTKSELVKILSSIKKIVPTYTRIERVIRDIPAKEIIEGGAKISNLRQVVLDNLSKEGAGCSCIRCREIKNQTALSDPVLRTLKYDASCGSEFFISIESDMGQLIGFCRLRLDKSHKTIKALQDAALVREIHVYGNTVALGTREKSSFQHQGWGKKMMLEAEKIAKDCGYKKVAVIAGVGVREYFYKLGYKKKSSYMLKRI